MEKSVHIIINPAAGKNEPILNTINNVFHPHDLDWSVSVTKKAGDAKELARRASENGVDILAIYGGDGSVMEAASGLMGTDVPLAILPGGTANVMSVELGVPQDLAGACTLLLDDTHQIREVDMGLLNDEHLFILRLATGFEAQMTKRADRQLKDRVGKLAYTLAGIMALRDPLNARYKFILDGQDTEEVEGISCMVANTSNLGLPGVQLSKEANVSDGKLDIILLKKAEQESIMKMLTFNISRSDDEIRSDMEAVRLTQQWQAREITLSADPPKTVIIDGEVVGKTPCEIKVVPNAVKIIVPA